jgi:hypothetical protein
MKRQSKNDEDKERCRRQAAMTVEALFPRSHYRLARMVDADKQLNALLDAFEREGMPMGSEFWAEYCLAQLHFLKDHYRILGRLMRDSKVGQDPDFEQANRDLEHARRMYGKRTPKPGEYECDYCGHRDAKRVTGTLTMCDPCREEVMAAKPEDANYADLTAGLIDTDMMALGLL